ncbi:MAG: hypothetical protein KatS3mg012_1764 [Gaiellaceae bacterium]|nr:MAG: hypothetical protein KatS3mg012_1764 [Gaiellaceae bacterium]
MSRVRRIAEEEYVVLVLLAGFGLIFLLVFPPFLLVNDSWLNLMAGREIWQNGLPSVDELTVYGKGRTWTAQQWLAHLFFYGTHALGGHALLAVATGVVVVGAFGIAAAGARSLGAGPRAIWALLLPVLMAAPWAWTIRAQMLALPLYTGLLWILASQARNPTRRVWLAIPILVLWANLHGSVALGALLVMLLAVHELVRSRGASYRRSGPLLLLAPLATLVTPYGPAAAALYYHLLLIDPPFAGRVTEWNWSAPTVNTMFFYVLVAIAVALVWLGRRRLTAFDVAVLALTLVGAVTAIRGIAWFALACMVLLPVAIGRSLESRRPAQPLRRLNRAIAVGCTALLVGTVAYLLARDEAWYESEWPRGPLEAVREELGEGDLVYAPDRFSDWLLWKIPELRGRVAYDVRFEIYDRAFFERLGRYAVQEGRDWKEIAEPFRIVLVDETMGSQTDDFLAEPGARAVYRDDEVTVIVRRPPS